MGLAGLTAVFGMGTGGAPPVSSPEVGRGAVRPPRPRWFRVRGHSRRARAGVAMACPSRTRPPNGSGSSSGGDRWASARTGRHRFDGGSRSGWSSRSAVRTGRLRRSPAVHSRPIDLVVFQEPSDLFGHGNLVLKRASRLDAFSAYPFPTWLPGGAPSGTAGTPEVGPPQSSRTRGDPSQVSSAHGR